MSFSYDLSTDIGKVRLLIPDKVEGDKLFEDDDIAAFLELEGDIKSAAAQALDVAATDHARVESFCKTQGLHVDGSKAAALMMERAEKLRGQNAIVEDDEDDLFDIAEMNVDDFSARQIAYNQSLRSGY